MATINGRQTSFVAAERLGKLLHTMGAPAVSRVAVPKSSRETVSDNDMKQIKIRQQAEALPEGQVRASSSKSKKRAAQSGY